MKYNKRYLGFIFLLICSLWAIRALFSPGYFPMHDDTQVSRVIAMGRALREGQFPVRWVSDLGYGLGYPIFNFYGPLPYYIGGILYAFGTQPLVATKIMFAIGLVFPALTMYLLAVDAYGVLGALVASLLYLFSPYHAVQTYIRGAIGESWMLIFLPLILYGILPMVHASKSKRILLGGVGLGGAILSHTIMGYVSVLGLVAGLIITVWKNNWTLVRHILLILLFGLGLTAFFWMPAISEMRYTNVYGQIGNSADYHDHFVCPLQLWDSQWGFGGSAKGCIDGLSFRLGKMHILFACLGIMLGYFNRKNSKRVFAFVISGVLISGISLFMLLPSSEPVWKVIPNLAYVQYPWRFLSIVIFGISFLAGAVFPSLRKSRLVLAFVAVFLIFSIYPKLFFPQYIYEVSDLLFESPEDMRFRVSKISDEYLSPQIRVPMRFEDVARDAIPEGPGYTVMTVGQTATTGEYVINAEARSEIVVNRVYFPGWKYRIDDKVIFPKIQSGLPVITLEPGIHELDMRFENTPVRILGNLISILSVFFVLRVYGKKTIT